MREKECALLNSSDWIHSLARCMESERARERESEGARGNEREGERVEGKEREGQREEGETEGMENRLLLAAQPMKRWKREYGRGLGTVEATQGRGLQSFS